MRSCVTALLLASAAWLSAPEARCAGVSPGIATPVQREQAQVLFQKGKRLFDTRQFKEALEVFRTAIEIVASPNARLYVARCLREMGKFVEAYVEFDRTAVEANEHARDDSRYQRTASTAQVERDSIVSKIGFIDMHIDHATDTTTLLIAGEEVLRAGWHEPVPVMPGDVEVVVATGAAPAKHKTVTIGAGEKQTVTLDAAPGPMAVAPTVRREKNRLRPYAYIAGGVGAAGMVTFTIAGLLSNAAYSDLSSECGAKPCSSSKQSEIARGQAEQTTANVGLGLGLAGLATGITLFIVSLPSKSTEAPATSPPAVGISMAPGWFAGRVTF